MVIRERQDEWRSSPVKIKKVKIGIKEALSGDEKLTEKVLELVKNQYEY